jgi:hypothetical protein
MNVKSKKAHKFNFYFYDNLKACGRPRFQFSLALKIYLNLFAASVLFAEIRTVLRALLIPS